MKDSKALHHLAEISETYGKQAAELKYLRGRVRKLTTQRDAANARNAELREHVAKYQKALSEARTEARSRQESAWVPYHDSRHA